MAQAPEQIRFVGKIGGDGRRSRGDGQAGRPGHAPAESAEPTGSAVAAPIEPEIIAPPSEAADEPATAAPIVLDEPATAPPADGEVAIEAGMDLPLPDGDAGPDARDRLLSLDFAGAGLGTLVGAVEFAAATQATTTPQPWQSVRLVLISGSHAGGAAAGDDPADRERRVAEVEHGEGVLSRLAGQAGADIAVLRTAESGAIEDGPALDEAAVDAALRQGWRIAEAAADAGRDLLVLASIGAGTDAVAAAISAAITGAEPVAVLPRVLRPGGKFDDESWMVRCAAVRDALHRIRQESRGAKDILRHLGGADLAVAAGLLLGAASRRLPVLLDGPVGIAAGLVARDMASQVRHWCLLPDAGHLALVKQGSDVLGLTPVLDLGLGLGEGANALAALPLLRTAIGLAAAAPVHPALMADLVVPNDEDVDLAEPEPHGPGPATTEPEPDDPGAAPTEPEPDGPGPATTGPDDPRPRPPSRRRTVPGPRPPRSERGRRPAAGGDHADRAADPGRPGGPSGRGGGHGGGAGGGCGPRRGARRRALAAARGGRAGAGGGGRDGRGRGAADPRHAPGRPGRHDGRAGLVPDRRRRPRHHAEVRTSARSGSRRSR